MMAPTVGRTSKFVDMAVKSLTPVVDCYTFLRTNQPHERPSADHLFVSYRLLPHDSNACPRTGATAEHRTDLAPSLSVWQQHREPAATSHGKPELLHWRTDRGLGI